MLLENRSGELIGAWPIDGALISTVRRSSVIFIMCVGFSRSLSRVHRIHSDKRGTSFLRAEATSGLHICH
jgi:hypothetical protein